VRGLLRQASLHKVHRGSRFSFSGEKRLTQAMSHRIIYLRRTDHRGAPKRWFHQLGGAGDSGRFCAVAGRRDRAPHQRLHEVRAAAGTRVGSDHQL